MEKRNFSFFNFRREAKERSPVFIEKDTRFEMNISFAEQIRFEENDRFADIIYNKMISLIDGDIGMEDLEDELFSLKEELSPAHQEIMKKIYANFKKVSKGEVCRHGLTLSELYKERPTAPYDLFVNYVEKEWGIPLSGKISYSDISVTSWGAVVVRISNKEIWNMIGKIANSKGLGFKISTDIVSIDKYENEASYVEEKDYRYVMKQINRTVLVYTGENTEEEIQSFTRHELFHELYSNVISSAYESRYKNREMDNIFRMIKSELTAYALSNYWQTEEISYFSTSYKEHDNIFDTIKKQIIISAIEDHLSEKEREEVNLGSLDKKISDYSVRFEKEPFLKRAKEESERFKIEMANLFREVARLRIRRNKDFVKATKIALTSQSLKEFVYKLSLIDSDEETDAIKVATENGIINLKEAIHIVRESIKFRIPINNLDKLVSHIEREMVIRDDISTDDRDFYELIIDYYKENKDRWLKSGEKRK